MKTVICDSSSRNKMPPKKKAGGPVEIAGAKPAPRKNVGVLLYSVKLNAYLFSRLGSVRKSHQPRQLRSPNARGRRSLLRLTQKSRRKTMYAAHSTISKCCPNFAIGLCCITRTVLWWKVLDGPYQHSQGVQAWSTFGKLS